MSKIFVIKSYKDFKLAIRKVAAFVDMNPAIPPALDLETTSLHPKDGVVRITTITCGPNTYVVDHFLCGAFADIGSEITNAAKQYLVFNIKFEGTWFLENEFLPNLWDVGFMRQCVMGGGPLSLALMCKWDLDIELDKDLQQSNWGAKELTEGQYYYAGLDGVRTFQLGEKWVPKLTKEQWNAFHLINNSWKAVVEMEQNGLLLDVAYHKKLIKMWEKRRAAAEKTFRKFIPEANLPNIRSKKQLSDTFKKIFDDSIIRAWPKTKKTEQLQVTRANLHELSTTIPYPATRAMAALQVFNRADKYLSTYGEKLITSQELSGRVYSSFNIMRAITGRFSSSGAMNAQNYPRAKQVRRSFVAREGCELIIADYSGIELRVLAEQSDDNTLRHDVIFGNAHAENAISMYKLDRERFFKALEEGDARAKQLRGNAKVLSFRIVYGAGLGAIAASLRCTIDEAEAFIRSWAHRYSRAYEYRNIQLEYLNRTGFLTCKSGRTIFVPKSDRTLPVASNYPIQGSAADVMYAACTILYDRLEAAEKPIQILATVHDELLLEAPNRHVKKASEILVSSMEDGWVKIYPGTYTDNLVELGHGKTWADKA